MNLCLISRHLCVDTTSLYFNAKIILHVQLSHCVIYRNIVLIFPLQWTLTSVHVYTHVSIYIARQLHCSSSDIYRYLLIFEFPFLIIHVYLWGLTICSCRRFNGTEAHVLPSVETQSHFTCLFYIKKKKKILSYAAPVTIGCLVPHATPGNSHKLSTASYFFYGCFPNKYNNINENESE